MVDVIVLARVLRAANPRADEAAIRAYAAALRDYAAAEANVAEHGAIVLHPRTGAPVENPFLGIRERSAAAMMKAKLRHTAEAWALIWPSDAAAGTGPAARG